MLKLIRWKRNEWLRRLPFFFAAFLGLSIGFAGVLTWVQVKERANIENGIDREGRNHAVNLARTLGHEIRQALHGLLVVSAALPEQGHVLRPDDRFDEAMLSLFHNNTFLHSLMLVDDSGEVQYSILGGGNPKYGNFEVLEARVEKRRELALQSGSNVISLFGIPARQEWSGVEFWKPVMGLDNHPAGFIVLRCILSGIVPRMEWLGEEQKRRLMITTRDGEWIWGPELDGRGATSLVKEFGVNSALLGKKIGSLHVGGHHLAWANLLEMNQIGHRLKGISELKEKIYGERFGNFTLKEHDLSWRVFSWLPAAEFRQVMQETILVDRITLVRLYMLFVLLAALVARRYSITKSEQQHYTDIEVETRNMLQRVIDHFPGQVFWTGGDGRLLGGNQFVANLLNLKSTSQLAGFPIAENKNLPPQLAWQTQMEICDLEQDRCEISIVVDQMGDERKLDVKSIRLPDQNGIGSGRLFLVDDVTDQFRNERDRTLSIARLEEELEIARRLIFSMLPSGEVRLPGLRVEAEYRPAGRVGGDFYDYLCFPPDLSVFLILDVMGHGVPAALNTTLARTVFRARIQEMCHGGQKPGPAEIIAAVNDDIVGNIGEDRFICVLTGVFDRKEGMLRLAFAGIPPTLILRQDGSQERISLSGTPIGIFAGLSWEEAEISFKPGDRALIYTDGVVDARNDREQMYGEERLVRSFEQVAKLSLPRAKERMLLDIRKFCRGIDPADDLTFLLLEGE